VQTYWQIFPQISTNHSRREEKQDRNPLSDPIDDNIPGSNINQRMMSPLWQWEYSVKQAASL
jgi:hypothetical protein